MQENLRFLDSHQPARFAQPELDTGSSVDRLMDSQFLIQSLQWKQLSDALYDFGHADPDKKTFFFEQVEKKLQHFFLLLVEFPTIYEPHCKQGNLTVNNDAMSKCILLRDELMQACLLSIHSGNPTPLHDHPGQAGIYFCLDGHLTLIHYDQVCSPISSQYPITKLCRTKCTQVAKGECAALDPLSGNIMELQSISRSSLLLAIRYQSEAAPHRHWFFPITPKRQDQSSFFARRIARYL